MTRPRPIVPRPDRPAPTQPKPGTPSPIHPDGPTRPPTRYVASIAWRWTQIGSYLAITTAMWACERIHRPPSARFRIMSSAALFALLGLGFASAAVPTAPPTPAERHITSRPYRDATGSEAIDQAIARDKVQH